MFVAIVGLLLPQILGPGEEFMHEVLSGHGETAFALLVILGVAKLIMTAISQAGGFQGGVFAPTLFIGIMFGSAYGHGLEFLPPNGLVGSPQNYAIAGMAGLLAGVVRAPITAILLVFELTDDYLLILPIMLTSVICVLIVERLGPEGIYMQSLVKHGIHLQQGRDVDVMQGISVREAMLTPTPTIDASANLSTLRQKFLDTRTRALCALDEKGYLQGIVTLGDLQRAFEKAIQADASTIDTYTVYDICTKEVITVEADDMLWTAIRNMGARDIGRLPVLNGNGNVIGMLRRQDIMNAYNTVIARKLHDQHFAEQIRLQTLTGAHVLECDVLANSELAHKMIRDVRWPPDAVVASISRGGKLIVPHGNTILRPYDRITIVADVYAESIIKHLFKQSAKAGEEGEKKE